MVFVVSICATRAYTHAMDMQARAVQQCVALTPLLAEAKCHVILSGDGSKELKEIEALYTRIMPESWKVHREDSVKPDEAAEVPHKDRDGDAAKDDKSLTLEDRQKAAALRAKQNRLAFRRVGDMREAAHTKAIRVGADYCWSLDSDVIPKPNSLHTSFETLAWAGGYYSVAFCPYPNMIFLGGLGKPGAPMNEDFLPHERALSRRHRFCLEECKRRLRAGITGRGRKDKPFANPPTNEQQRLARLEALARTKGPDGSIWEVNAKYGWRRRGWLDQAYPGIGKGALVPVDWCGFGCTLMNRPALAVADFASYGGDGTEDIHVIANRWEPEGIRIGCITHCPADHVIFEKVDGKAQRVYLRTFHEAAGEHRGHLRIEKRIWDDETTPTATRAVHPTARRKRGN